MEGSIDAHPPAPRVLDHGKPVPSRPTSAGPSSRQCFYWLHTHTPDGIIHVESPTSSHVHARQLLRYLGRAADSRQRRRRETRKGEQIVQVWVDGTRYTGDPRKIELTQHLDMTIEVGPPYKKPAPFTTWNGN